jgi:hypothetical protein
MLGTERDLTQHVGTTVSGRRQNGNCGRDGRTCFKEF